MRRALAVAMLIASCGSGQGDNQLIVSAASSLTIAFTEMEAAFESQVDGVDVVMNFAASTTLREQILEGAPVDVFASADASHVQAVSAAGVAFTTNRLVIGVAAGNPPGIDGIDDLNGAGLLVGRCAAAVPCGAATQLVGVDDLQFATIEPNVRSLVAKIESGDLDAGFVYASDAVSSGSLDAIDVGAPDVDYVIAALTDAPLALQFSEFVRSDTGQDILRRNGFGS